MGLFNRLLGRTHQSAKFQGQVPSRKNNAPAARRQSFRPTMEALEQREVLSTLSVPAPGVIVTATDASNSPSQVKVFDAKTGNLLASFNPFGANFGAGVRVAVGDVNGDGTPDVICAAGPGAGPLVNVYDGKTFQMIRSFFAFSPSFIGGVNVAAGDVNGDGCADIICALDAGGAPQVTVFSGKDNSVLSSFYAFPTAFAGGVRVAAGDVNGDGRADVICAAGPGGAPLVEVFDGTKLTQRQPNVQLASSALLSSFFAFPPTYIGGVNVAAGDVNGDGFADVICGAGTLPLVTVRSGANGTILGNFFAPNAPGYAGVRVGTTTVDGFVRILTAPGSGPASGNWLTPNNGAAPEVDVYSGQSLAEIDSFFAFDPSYSGGVFVGG